MDVHIRWMILRDAPKVLAIENASFEFHWDEETLRECLRQRNNIGLVAEFEEQVVGFVCYELSACRLEILNFAVDHTVRRRTVGRQIIEKLISKLSLERRNTLCASVRETNLGALNFFKSMGFLCSQVLKEPYEEIDEDAYLMQYRLRDPTDFSPKNRISGVLN